jgi:DNA helicase-2/ATP-dependent DNA helicase PcrA
MHNKLSRFVREIPTEYIEYIDCSERISLGGNTRSTPKPNYLRDHSAVVRTAAAASAENFSAGDRVKHNKFGEGTVISASPIGNDTLIEISFDTVGTKKLMANFAKITKIE